MTGDSFLPAAWVMALTGWAIKRVIKKYEEVIAI
jgi:hypothetical protein